MARRDTIDLGIDFVEFANDLELNNRPDIHSHTYDQTKIDKVGQRKLDTGLMAKNELKLQNKSFSSIQRRISDPNFFVDTEHLEEVNNYQDDIKPHDKPRLNLSSMFNTPTKTNEVPEKINNQSPKETHENSKNCLCGRGKDGEEEGSICSIS